MKKEKPILDYSSPDQEQRRERSAQDDRREGVERYNEATFGDRRPIAAAILRAAVVLVIVGVLVWLLPRRTGRLAALLLLAAFAVWEALKPGSASRGWTSLRYPWRRW